MSTKAPAKPAPTTHEELLERFKDYPAIDVIERRFLDPNDPGSIPILLKEEHPHSCLNTDHQRRLQPGKAKCHLCRLHARKWHLHYCNTTIEGRWAQMKSKGYIPVHVKELKDQEDVSDLVKQTEENGEMWVRRGDRGKEVLMKQPLELYNAIKQLQAQQRKARFTSRKALKDDLAESAGMNLGSEAGDFVSSSRFSVESLKHEKTTLGEEAGDE